MVSRIRHRRTDPGCIEHSYPTSVRALRRFNLARGISCPLCFPRVTFIIYTADERAELDAFVSDMTAYSPIKNEM